MRDITMVIPTYNSPQVLDTMLTSLFTNTDWDGRVIVVNNGEPGLQVHLKVDMIIEAGSNLGWMGGVNAGLREADSDFFVFGGVFAVALSIS